MSLCYTKNMLAMQANRTKIMQKVVDQYIIFCYNNGMLSSNAKHFLTCKATFERQHYVRK